MTRPRENTLGEKPVERLLSRESPFLLGVGVVGGQGFSYPDSQLYCASVDVLAIYEIPMIYVMCPS